MIVLHIQSGLGYNMSERETVTTVVPKFSLEKQPRYFWPEERLFFMMYNTKNSIVIS